MTATRRTALLGSAGLIAGLAAGSLPSVKATTLSADASTADPIFAAIARTRKAWDALADACTATYHAQLIFGLDSVQYELADAAQSEVSTRYGEVLDECLAVVPTTLEGVVAYIDFLGDIAAFRDVAIESWQQEVIAATLKAAVLRYVDLPASTAPIAEAVPVTRELLENYDAWLVYEHERLNDELGNKGSIRVNIPGADYHMPRLGQPASPSPSTRAARVLAAVGCPLKWEA